MTSPLFDLSGKIALVTGASRGIGAAVATTLAAAGAKVVVNYHQPAESEFGRDNAADALAVVSAITAAGGAAVALNADVSSQPAVEAMVAETVEHLDGIDILVNNAGICPFHDFFDMPLDLWQKVQDVNLTGAFIVTQAVARQMREQGRGGRIISISSISALVGGAQQTHYTPTKAGIHSLMQSLAIVLGPYGITCNSIMPGAIGTDINADDLGDPEKRAYLEKRIPLGRIGTPDDIAGPVLFLASDAARYVNGASVLVDGGIFVNLQ